MTNLFVLGWVLFALNAPTWMWLVWVLGNFTQYVISVLMDVKGGK